MATHIDHFIVTVELHNGEVVTGTTHDFDYNRKFIAVSIGGTECYFNTAYAVSVKVEAVH